MERRAFLAGGLRAAGAAVVLGGGATMLDACGSSAPGSQRNTRGVPTGPPRRGGTLRIGTEAEVNGVDPTRSDLDATGLLYARAFYDPLAAIAADGSVKPYLARSIDHSADYTRWTITARPGVVFHDGTPFDASALVANLNAQLTSPLTGTFLSEMIGDVAKVDDMTVRVDMSSPWVPFDVYLAGWIGGQLAYVASPKALAAGTLSDHPVGTGPFVFQSWEPGSHMTGTRNRSYWRSGMPYLDSLTFLPMPEDQTRVDSLQAGDIDICHITDVAHFRQAHSEPGFSWVDNLHGEVGEPDQDFLMINTAKPPLDDLRVRQALAHALDTSSYNTFANEGVTPVDLSPFARGSVFFGDAGYPLFDLARARSLVQAYQADKQTPVVVDLGDTTGTTNTNDMSLVARMWEKAGIRVNQQQILQSKYIVNALLGDYGVYSWRQFGAVDPDQNYPWWLSRHANPIGTIAVNFARNKDPVIDRALIVGRQNPDPSARTAAYRKVGERLNADLPYIWQNRNLWAVVARPHVVNYNAYSLPDGSAGLGMKSGVFPVVNAWVE